MLSDFKRKAARIARVLRGSGNKHPNWQRILAKSPALWRKALAEAAHGPLVLIATSVGKHYPSTIVESTLAAALTLRGARVHVFLCDRFLPACLLLTSSESPNTDGRDAPRPYCQDCFSPANKMFQALRLPVHRFSDFVTAAEIKLARKLSSEMDSSRIADYRLDGLAVGEHALAGALRFFARGDLAGEPLGQVMLARYFHASLLTAYATRRLLEQYAYRVACFNHGIYVPQGIIGEVARQRNVRVVNWNPAYRKKSFIFSHHETYHHSLLSEPTANWESLPWTAAMENQTLDYLKSRWQGTNDWIWFHEKPQEEASAIAAELGIDFGRPCIGLLSNVIWDAQLHYRANAFPNMVDWTLRTIQYFSQRPDLQLVIRVHPAEIRGTIPSRQRLDEEIRRAFPVLPSNVFVVPPESPVSTYALMMQCDSVVIYGTKTGVELTAMGIPVIVAGEAWIRNKGLTMDATSPEEYFKLLDRLPLQQRLDQDTVRRARKYAFHFFFRRMIPWACMEPASGWPPYHLRIAGLEDLLPGHDPGLDVVCEGILNGTEFAFPAESFVAGDG